MHVLQLNDLNNGPSPLPWVPLLYDIHIADGVWSGTSGLDNLSFLTFIFYRLFGLSYQTIFTIATLNGKFSCWQVPGLYACMVRIPPTLRQNCTSETWGVKVKTTYTQIENPGSTYSCTGKEWNVWTNRRGLDRLKVWFTWLPRGPS